MLRPETFHRNPQLHGHIPVGADKLVVFQFDHISLFPGDRRRNLGEFSRLIRQKNGNCKDPVAEDQPLLYDG